MTIVAKLSGMLKATRSAAAEVREGLESVRVQIIALKDKRQHLEFAPVPKAEALKRLDDFTAFISERAARLITPEAFMHREGYRMPALESYNLDAGDLALGLAAPVVRDLLAAKIEAKYAATDGPTADEHRRMLEKLDAEILDLELV
ncbi:MAG: hypothetical protein E5V46_31550, partial [Mesorhizobium sp.]